ncbi:MAG: hypothetical protein ACM3SO_12160 [Betaproteobacteria bacterium]
MKTNGYDGSYGEMQRLVARARVQRAMVIAEMISDGIAHVSTLVGGLWKKRTPPLPLDKRALAPR